MRPSQKFMFENCFDQTSSYVVEEEDEVVEPPPPTFSEDDIAAARANGFVEGRAAGIAEMQSGIDQSLGTVMADLLSQLESIGTAQETAHRTLEHRMLSLSTTIARKVVPQIARDHAESAIEQIIRDCLPKLLDEPRIVLRVHVTLLEELRSKVDSLAANSGFQGDIILLPDDELGQTDCRVEWADGGAEKSEDRIWAAIDAAIESHLGVAPIQTDAALPAEDAPQIDPTNSEAHAGFPNETNLTEEKPHG